MIKHLDFGAMDRRTIVKAGAVAGLVPLAAPFIISARGEAAIRSASIGRISVSD